MTILPYSGTFPRWESIIPDQTGAPKTSASSTFQQADRP
jgi:hypothetical protein